MLLLGIDGGGTGCRARLTDLSGTILGEGIAGPANVRFGVELALRAVQEASLSAVTTAGLGPEALEEIYACLGLAGCTEPDLLAKARSAAPPFRASMVTSDAHIACIGAHDGDDGGIIIVGTGTCGWAVLGAEHFRVGGWGFPVSDEGSGAWLGLEALRRVLWAYDGRTRWTPLTQKLFARFDADAQEIVRWMTSAKPGDFATLAPDVVEHGTMGDPAARELMRLAAAYIEELIARLLGFGVRRLSLVGGLAQHVEP